MPDLKIKYLKIKPESRLTSRLVAEKGRARLGLDRLVRGKRGQSEARARSGRAEPSRAFLTLHELGELKRSGSRRPLISVARETARKNFNMSSLWKNPKVAILLMDTVD